MTRQLPAAFRALQHRNYALFFSGQSLSYIGTWMQRTAVSWVVYSLTHSTLMLGLSVFAQQFPSFLLSLVGGIISDRYDRRAILLLTQTASLLQAAALAALVLSKHYEIWQLLALSALLGIINAFDVPARQPLVHQLVAQPEDLPNALALNSAMVNAARLVGPALSGLVLQAYGAGTCFLLNALSFLAVLASLLLLKLPASPKPATPRNALAEFTAGLAYLRATPSLNRLILLLALVSLLVLPYDTLLPVFTNVVFHGNAATFGYLSSGLGIGALAGAFVLATLKKGPNLRVLLAYSTFLTGGGLLVFSQVRSLPLALLVAVVCGLGALFTNTLCFTILQLEAAPAMRGRVMSYISMAYFGMIPLGSLLVGATAGWLGAPTTLVGQGMLALLIGAAFYSYLTRPSVPAA